MQNAKISKPPRFTLRLVLPRLTQTHFQHLQHLHVRHFTLLFNLRIHCLVAGFLVDFAVGEVIVAGLEG